MRSFFLRPLLCLCVCLIPAAPVGYQGQASRVIVIEGGTLIDATGAPPRPNARIVIEADKIRSVSSASDDLPPAGAQVIRAQGKFILPGLIDAHTHWRGWTGQLFLAHGVTTIVDLGNSSNWILAVKAAEAAGRLRGGPRIFAAGDAIGRGPKIDWREPGVGSSRASAVENTAQARMAARSLIGKGADLIKVHDDVTGDGLAAIIEEAHKVDLAVVGHSRDVRDAISRGLDGIAGLRGVAISLMSPQDKVAFDEGRVGSPYARMDTARGDELAGLLVQRGTYVSPIFISEFGGVVKQARRFELASYDLLARPGLRHVPLNALLSSLAAFRSLRSYSESLGPSPYTELVGDSVGEEFRRGYGNAQEFIRRLAARGGKVVAGSDAAASPTVPGAALHQELELLVEAGLSPMQAIQAATKHPAELFRQGYKLGTVEPAKLADLVILDGDPLADIRNLGKIHIVLKNGTVMDTRYRATYAPELAELEDVGVSSSTAPVPRIFEVITRTLNTWSMVINNGSPFDVIVKGQGFHSMSVVHLNGRPLATTFVSSGELRARVPTQSIPAAGVFPVTVVTPWPGGGTSNPVGLVVK